MMIDQNDRPLHVREGWNGKCTTGQADDCTGGNTASPTRVRSRKAVRISAMAAQIAYNEGSMDAVKQHAVSMHQGLTIAQQAVNTLSTDQRHARRITSQSSTGAATMKTATFTRAESGSRSRSADLVQTKSPASMLLADNRPEATAQRKAVSIMHDSPHTLQRKAWMDLANNNAPVRPGKSDAAPVQRKAWSTGALDGKSTNVNWTTGVLGGDTVGMKMDATVLGPDHVQGGPPKTGAQKNLMNQLPTDPHLSNSDKYIRGHLLNDNLGGPGEPENLYPITSNANKEHEQVIESQVKHWVNEEKQWVSYQVEVLPGHVDLTNGIVNSKLSCKASILDPATLAPINPISATITSEYSKTHATDRSKAVDAGHRGTVGAQAALHTVLLSTSKKAGLVFDQETLDHLEYLFTLPEAAKTLKKLLMEYEGIGKGTAEALSKYSPTTDTDKKVIAALNKVFTWIGNDNLLAIVGDVYDEVFSS